MSGLTVSLMLCFAEIVISLGIKSLLDLLERISDLVFLILILRKVISLIAVPVDILLRTFLIDVVTVGDIELAVIVLRIVSSVFSGSAIVFCQLHRHLSFLSVFDKHAFPLPREIPQNRRVCRQVIPSTK